MSSNNGAPLPRPAVGCRSGESPLTPAHLHLSPDDDLHTSGRLGAIHGPHPDTVTQPPLRWGQHYSSQPPHTRGSDRSLATGRTGRSRRRARAAVTKAGVGAPARQVAHRTRRTVGQSPATPAKTGYVASAERGKLNLIGDSGCPQGRESTTAAHIHRGMDRSCQYDITLKTVRNGKSDDGIRLVR